MLNKSHFLLQENVAFLNHGSFGACPIEILEEQRRWQDRLERQPVQFFRDSPALMQHARRALAEYIGAVASDVVYVTNSTYGVNVAAFALAQILGEGDEILLSDHEYGACTRTWQEHCEKRGAKLVQAQIPLPAPSAEVIVDLLWEQVTERTKVLFVSHVTSPTAVLLPIKELCAKAKKAGIITVVDGSHAPGHIGLQLNTLGADVYTANCHKWMCTPKGSAFLWVRSDLHRLFPPFVVSWGDAIDTVGDGAFVNDHEYLGTRDISPFLSVPYAIEWMKMNNWDAVQSYGRGLARRAAELLLAIPGIMPMVPGGYQEELMMSAVLLPQNTDVLRMKNWLYNERAIEVVVHRWLDRAILRCSAHAHTSDDDVRRLVEGVAEYVDTQLTR